MTAWTERLTQVVFLASLAIGAVAAWYALPLDREIKALQAETARLDNWLKLSDAD